MRRRRVAILTAFAIAAAAGLAVIIALLLSGDGTTATTSTPAPTMDPRPTSEPSGLCALPSDDEFALQTQSHDGGRVIDGGLPEDPEAAKAKILEVTRHDPQVLRHFVNDVFGPTFGYHAIPDDVDLTNLENRKVEWLRLCNFLHVLTIDIILVNGPVNNVSMDGDGNVQIVNSTINESVIVISDGDRDVKLRTYCGNQIIPQHQGQMKIVKFHDPNENGVREQGEILLEGFLFQVTGPENFEVISNAYSETIVNVAPGMYIVREVEPSGWRVSHQTSNPQVVTVVEGQTPVETMFGNVQIVPPGETPPPPTPRPTATPKGQTPTPTPLVTPTPTPTGTPTPTPTETPTPPKTSTPSPTPTTPVTPTPTPPVKTPTPTPTPPVTKTPSPTPTQPPLQISGCVEWYEHHEDPSQLFWLQASYFVTQPVAEWIITSDGPFQKTVWDDPNSPIGNHRHVSVVAREGDNVRVEAKLANGSKVLVCDSVVTQSIQGATPKPSNTPAPTPPPPTGPTPSPQWPPPPP